MSNTNQTLPLSTEQLIKDYRLGFRSRQASIIGRREVLTGKAKFGIFGDGKELIQLAIAHHFRPGDWRSGYYRDQTWMMALNLISLEQFFAQLYAHADTNFDPHSGGRNMNGHFASQLIDENGEWISQSDRYNSSADAAPTASQMPRTVGLAYASVLYKNIEELHQFDQFSHKGKEVTWASIGNASTAEGPFWETVNAIGVLKPRPSSVSMTMVMVYQSLMNSRWLKKISLPFWLAFNECYARLNNVTGVMTFTTYKPGTTRNC